MTHTPAQQTFSRDLYAHRDQLARKRNLSTMAVMTPLDLVDLAPSKASEAGGLVRVHGTRHRLPMAEEAAVREAALFHRVDFVFFRRFSDGRSPQAAAYVVDNSDERLSKDELAELHWHVWMHGVTPLLYVAWPTRLDVLACSRTPDFWKDTAQKREYPEPERLALSVTIETAAQVSDELARVKKYSAYRLADGTFWDDPENKQLLDVEKAAHQQLITAIVETDLELKGSEKPALRRLLLLTLLVKYLEDRAVFPSPAWFGRFRAGARSFLDLLQHGTPKEIASFFEFLENRFRGDVFSLHSGDLGALNASMVREFAELIEARTLKKQRYLWQQYSFRHLPVEVLSHLYQRFAQKGHGAIFTPPFVASLLLDYALPYHSMSGREKILDPTCGSGVFLVGAFKRLVHYWRSRNSWRQPSVGTLKDMLSKQIHGVELQGMALDLAGFNLALALCDALRPDIIWHELKFDRLRDQSLHEADFFDFASQREAEMADTPNDDTGKFDVIIGNPPFLSTLTPAAQQFDSGTRGRLRVPDKQIAYLIAERSMALLSKSGRICLLEPSGLIYNEKPVAYFRQFISRHRTYNILDFTSVRQLFDEADTKVVAVIAEKAPPAPDHRIEHFTFRRTVLVDQRLGFELDHYDRHVLPQAYAADRPEAWKINLLGGGRLHFLSERLRGMGTLSDFVGSKRNKGWDYGEGYIAANSEPRSPASWLHGKPLIPSVAIGDKGIDVGQITTVKEKLFRSAYTESRYTAPLFLIRENEKLPSAWIDSGFLAYKAQIVGISAPERERKALKQFADDFLRYREEMAAFCLLRGTRGLASKATAINKTDIDNLPWPKPGEAWNLSKAEKILCSDLLLYMGEFVRRGQNSALLQNEAQPDDMRTYSSMFVNTLLPVHENLRAGEFYNLNGLACQMFYFGDRPQLDWSTKWGSHFEKLVYFSSGFALRTVRVLRFYQSNVILIIKPNRLRYWIRSIAIRDADESLRDLTKQGF